MTYRVRLVIDAEDDLIDLHRYVARHDSVEQADWLLERFEESCASLTSLSERGHPPPELERVGVTAFREVHFKPYRIIYEVSGRDVFVHAIVDGRRSLQDLLHKRLLR